MTRLLVTIGATLLLAAPAALACNENPGGDPIVTTEDGYCLTGSGNILPCPEAPAVAFDAGPSSSPVCRILDAAEPVVMVPDAEILSTDPGTRSLANGWLPAAFVAGSFVCVPVVNPSAWTDDSGAVYDAPNTAYANPIG